MAFNDNGLRSKLSLFPERPPQVLASWCACCACMGKVGSRKLANGWFKGYSTRPSISFLIGFSAKFWMLADDHLFWLHWDRFSDEHFWSRCPTGAGPFQVMLLCLFFYIPEHWSKYHRVLRDAPEELLTHFAQVSEGVRIRMDLFEVRGYFEAKNWLTENIAVEQSLKAIGWESEDLRVFCLSFWNRIKFPY